MNTSDNLPPQDEVINNILRVAKMIPTQLAREMGVRDSQVTRWTKRESPQSMRKASRVALARVIGRHYPTVEEIDAFLQRVGLGWRSTDEEYREALAQLRLYDMPRVAPESFLGRTDQLDELRGALLRSEPPQSVIILVQGVPGVGKTWLAVRALDDVSVKRRYPDGIHWVTLEYEESGNPPPKMDEVEKRALHSLSTRIIEKIDPKWPPTFEEVQQKLRGKQVLLVLDDVEEPIDIDEWVLVSPLVGKLLVTTRRTDLESDKWRGQVRKIRVDEMPPEDSRELLTHDVPLDISESELNCLLTTLAGLPLALDIVNRIARFDKGFRTVLAQLRESLIPALEIQGVVKKQNSVRVAFELSYRRLDNQAQGLLRCLSVSPQPFHLLAMAQAYGLNKTQAAESLRQLEHLGLVQVVSFGIYRTHRLLHEYCRLLAQEQDANNLPLWHAGFATYYFNQGEFPEAYGVWQGNIVHIERACQYAYELGKGDWVLRYFMNASQYLTMVGSESILDTWWKWVQELVKDEWQTAHASLRMAACCRVLGRHEESISLARRARQVYEKGLDDVKNRALWGHCARLELVELFSLGRLSEAEQLWGQIQSVSPNVGLIDPPDMMLSTIRRVALPQEFSTKDRTEPSTE